MRHIPLVFTVVFSLGIVSQYGTVRSEDKTTQTTLSFGFPKFVLPELNEQDARAAIRIWTHDAIEYYHYDYRSSVHIFPDLNSLVQAMNAGHINLVVLPVIDYIELSKTITLFPGMCAKIHESVLDRFVLIVRKDSRYTGLKDLANKTLLVKQESTRSVQEIWREVLLHEAGLPGSDQFFGQIVKKERESQLIFPLLLKQADCCIMTEGAFLTMSELNPQLNAQLTPLLTSDPYLASAIFCYTERLDEEARRDVTAFAINWEENKGRDQLQTIFRFNTLVPFEENYLESVMSLLSRYKRFQKETP